MLRRKSVEFLIQASDELEATSVVKYTALSFFAHQFLPSFTTLIEQGNDMESFLLRSMEQSNLQLFALISIWISNKIHDVSLLSVQHLKSLGDKYIKDQHFTTRDYLQAEVDFLKVLKFRIGTSESDIAFTALENLFIKLKEVPTVGEKVSLEACMEVMDLLYEKEDTSILFSSPRFMAAAILVTSYVIAVDPKQELEFPALPWVKFVTSYEEEDIVKSYEEEDIAVKVKHIIMHVLEPHQTKKRKLL